VKYECIFRSYYEHDRGVIGTKPKRGRKVALGLRHGSVGAETKEKPAPRGRLRVSRGPRARKDEQKKCMKTGN